MLITKFNKLIRNRFLWAVFAVIVCLSFILAGSATRNSCNRSQSNRALRGEIDGKGITPHEFLIAQYAVLHLRSPSNLSKEYMERIRQQTWKRLAALEGARQLGLSVSDDEIRREIRNDPTFAPQGAFSRQRYEWVLSQIGVSSEIYEEYLRQEILLRKAMRVLESTVWISPEELEEQLKNFTDEFTVEYVLFNEDDIRPKTRLTEEAVREYFESHKQDFRIPEKVRVRYVSFPISNYLNDVTVTEDQIDDYYNDHLDSFTTTVSNDHTEATPIDEVREDIVQRLRQQQARFKAEDVATGLVMDLAPDRSGNAMKMGAAAEKRGVAVHTSEVFSLEESVPGLNVGSDFNKAAFNLEAGDADRYFSDAITGTDAVFVIAADERAPGRIPELAEVEDKVKIAAQHDARQKAFFEEANRIRTHILEDMEKGSPFEKAVRTAGFTVATTLTFTAYSSYPEDPHLPAILPQILPLQEGQLSPVVPEEKDAVLAYVKDREPADLQETQGIRSQLLAALEYYRAQFSFEEWKDYLVAHLGVRDFSQTGEREPDEEEPE